MAGARSGGVSADVSFGLRREEVSLHSLINSDGSVNLHPSPTVANAPPAGLASPVSTTASEVSNDWGELDLQDEMSLVMTPITSPAAREVGRMRRAVSYGADSIGTERMNADERSRTYTPRRQVKF